MLAITLFHNSELGWLIGASWDRFTLQLIPPALIVLFSMWPKGAYKHLRVCADYGKHLPVKKDGKSVPKMDTQTQ